MQPHRSWHNQEHVTDLIDKIKKDVYTESNVEKLLILTAIYHDLIYETKNVSYDNEFLSACICVNDLRKYLSNDELDIIFEIIMSTKNNGKTTTCELAKKFNDLDCAILYSEDEEKLLEYAKKISFEHQHMISFDYFYYRERFLQNFKKDFPKSEKSIDFLLQHLEDVYGQFKF